MRDNACCNWDSAVIILDIACEDTLNEHAGAQAYGFDVAIATVDIHRQKPFTVHHEQSPASIA